MAGATFNDTERMCATCGEPYALNPRYSAAQRARSRYCSHRCSGVASAPQRTPMLDLLGGQRRFGMLTFISEGDGTKATRRGVFRCDCGREKLMALHHIKRGKSVSCGCENARRSASRFTKHGGYATPEYGSWSAMMQRCHNEGDAGFPAYGGRGIRVCPQWHGPEGFRRFVAYIGNRPHGHTLDRLDNDKGYEPGNVRWATPKQQQNNRRVSKLYTYQGETMNARDWAARFGFGKNTIDARIAAGWSVEEALTTPRLSPTSAKRRRKSRT